MGLFRWKNAKTKGCVTTDAINLHEKKNSLLSDSEVASTMKATPWKRGGFRRHPSAPQGPSLDHLPDLILDLKTAVDTAHERSVGALRQLFALSEFDPNIRVEMVHAEDGALVPALLYFLDRCARKSPEQFLSLLVLNNISIPMENKRVCIQNWSRT